MKRLVGTAFLAPHITLWHKLRDCQLSSRFAGWCKTDDLLVFPPAMVLQQLHSNAEVVGERSYLPSWFWPQAGLFCISGEVAKTASATCSRTVISYSMLGGKADCLEFSSLFPHGIEAGTDTDVYLSI